MLMPMKATTIMAVWTAMAAAAIGMATPAQAATVYQFISADGNIACSMTRASDDAGNVACEIRDYVFNPVSCPSGQAGNRFVLNQGDPAQVECHSGTMLDPSLPTLSYEQSRNVGLIDCVVLPGNHVECTDRATDHYFRIFSDHYDVG
jgi:hypothetical protein